MESKSKCLCNFYKYCQIALPKGCTNFQAYMTSPFGLGFLKEWWLSSKNKHPKRTRWNLFSLLRLSLRNHIVSLLPVTYSRIRDIDLTSPWKVCQCHLVRIAHRMEDLLSSWKIQLTTHLVLFLLLNLCKYNLTKELFWDLKKLRNFYHVPWTELC